MLAKVTAKGQLTLPKMLRDRLQLRAGDKVEFLVHDDGRVEMLAVTASVTQLKGMVPKPARSVSLDAMEAAIRRGAHKS